MTQIIEVPGHGQVEFPDGMSDEQIAAAIKKNLLVGKPSAANAGLANFGASVLGLPIDTATAAYNLFKAGIGTAQHKLFGNELPELTRNPLGGSENIRNMLRRTGDPGLNPDNPNPASKMGTAQYNFVSRGGFIPGGALPAAGSMIAEKIGGPEWAGVGAMTPQALMTGYNAARAPSLARQESQNAPRDATLSAALQQGYVVPPSSAGGGFLTRRLESIGGKAAIGQEAAVRNQQVTNRLARKALGLADDAPLNEQTLRAMRAEAGKVYEGIRASGTITADTQLSQKLDSIASKYKSALAEFPGLGKKDMHGRPLPDEVTALIDGLKVKQFSAGAAVDAIKVLREKSSDAFASQNKAFGNAAKGAAGALEDMLERHLVASKAPAGSVESFRDARRLIAKTYDVENALNVGTGDISARVLGRSLDRGAPLSGELATAGRFSEAFPAYAREGVTIPPPGVSKSEAIMGSLLGLGGYSALGPYGVALAALPLASGPTRSLLLSKPYQRGVLSPDYAPGMTPAPAPQLLYQLGILQQRQQQ